jgi:hypothetical protein
MFAAGGWRFVRWQRHGLDGRAGSNVLDDLPLLGVQGSRQAGGAIAAPANEFHRSGERHRGDLSRRALVSLWSLRGAPHAHRVTSLNVRDALATPGLRHGGATHVEAAGEALPADQRSSGDHEVPS